MNVAVVLAGGVGRRFGGDLPKQFLQVAGKTVIEWTISAFQANAGIDEIVVVINVDYVNEMQQIVVRNRATWTKFKSILIGGEQRFDSSMSAIKAYTNKECNLIFHDAARPFVSQRIINDVVFALQKYNAVAVAVPATDTVVQVDDSGCFINSILQRSQLRCQQTPQAFDNALIAKAYAFAEKDKSFVATDDCGVVTKFLPAERIFIVTGEAKNIKITYKDDLWLAEKILQARME